MSLSTSSTVWSLKDAVRLRQQGCIGVSCDPKLKEGEWYHDHAPNYVYRLCDGMRVQK